MIEKKETLAEIHSQEIMVALRKVIRAIDIHSRSLMQSHGLTGPQALILAKLYTAESLSARQLATSLSLSPATITDVLKRLQAKKLINKKVDQNDRRVTLISLTAHGKRLHESAPPLLQHQFEQQFLGLKDWERHQLVSSLQRIAELMGGKEIDAAPVLTTTQNI